MTVPRVEYVLDTSQAFPKGGEWSTAVRGGAAEGVRKALALVERHHKTQEMERGNGAGAAIPDKITRRTGALARSYSIRHQRDSLEGSYGSDLKRARLLERGGTIVPVKAGALAIPTQAAKHGVGGALGPRAYEGLFRPRGKSYLARRNGDSLEVMFHLKQSVTVPARPTLHRTAVATSAEVAAIIADAIKKAMDDA
mgnify:CR=1 FL=1